MVSLFRKKKNEKKEWFVLWLIVKAISKSSCGSSLLCILKSLYRVRITLGCKYL